MSYGFNEGDTCGRNGCDGVLVVEYEGSECTCHINPPCNYCVSGHVVCPECGWEECKT